MKRFLFALTLLTISSFATAQKTEGYHLNFKINGIKDTTVYLANYFGAKLYYADTAQANHKGEVVFSGKKPLATGKYAVVVPGPRYFELFVQEQRFSMETDTIDYVKHMVIKDSPNNKLLYDYIHFIIKQRLASERLNKQLAEVASDPDLSLAVSEKIVALNKTVKDYQTRTVADNPDLIAAKSLKIMMPIEVPKAPVNEDGKVDSLYSYHYYTNHFFDNIDLTDNNMVRLPEFHQKLDEYFNKVIIQSPDTINARADKLIAQVANADELYRYVVQYVTNNFETSQIMGMDAVFLHMAETYYQQGKTPWMDSTAIAKIDERVERMKPTMLGNIAPSLILADTTLNNWINMHNTAANYTVVYFYDPDCGHCKKKTPVLTERFEGYQDKGVVIFAVSGGQGKDWTDFIHSKGLDKTGIYNVTAPQRVYEDSEYATQLILSGKTDYKSLNYRTTYDVFTTPKVMLLSKDKKILAKQVGVEQVFDIIDDIERRKQAN